MLADGNIELVYQISTLPYDCKRESVTCRQRESLHVVTELRWGDSCVLSQGACYLSYLVLEPSQKSVTMGVILSDSRLM